MLTSAVSRDDKSPLDRRSERSKGIFKTFSRSAVRRFLASLSADFALNPNESQFKQELSAPKTKNTKAQRVTRSLFPTDMESKSTLKANAIHTESNDCRRRNDMNPK